MSVLRNSIYNLGSSIVPTIISIFTIPIYIHQIGEARYGILAIFAILMGYFGVFDFGLSVATAQRIAASGRHDLEVRRRIFWTAATVNLLLGLISAVAIIPFAYFYFGFGMRSPEGMRPELIGVVPWLAAAVPFMMLTGVMRGALQGLERFAEINMINIVTSTLSQLIPLAAAFLIGPNLQVIMPVLFLTRLLALGAYAVVVARHVTSGWKPVFDAERVRDLFSFGGWVAVSGLIGPLMTLADRFIIGVIQGPRAVSHYTIPYELAARGNMLPGALVDALYPRVAGAKDDGEAVLLCRRGLHAAAAIMTPLMTGGIVFVRPFLEVWLGASFAAAAYVPAQILLVGFWFNALGFFCFIRLQATGQPRLIAIVHAIELVPYFAMLALGLHYLGLPGAALAFSLRMIIDVFLLGWKGGLMGQVATLGIPATVVFVFAAWLSLGMQSLLSWQAVAGIGLVLAVCAVSLRWLYQERETLRSAFVISRQVSRQRP